MSDLWLDVRYGARMLARSPGFTAVAVISLALGIGLNTAVFSVVHAVLFKPLPVPEPERLAQVFTTSDTDFLEEGPLAFPDYRDFRDRTEVFEELFAYNLEPLSIERGEESRLVMGELVTGGYFGGLGVGPQLGRLIGPGDDDAGAAASVAVLSERTWRRRFGGDPDVLGQTVRLNGYPFTVIGVTQGDFKGLVKGITPEVWVPMETRRVLYPGESRLDERGARWVMVMGRLAPGVSVEQAQSALEPVAEWAARELPKTNANRGVKVRAAAEVAVLPGIDQALYTTSAVLLGLVGLILLIACANVANLLLARAHKRQGELAVRLSLGAGRGRVVRQLMVESLLLALVAGGVALLLAVVSNRLLNSPSLPLPLDLQIDLGLGLDLQVFGYALTAAVLTALLFGLAPALRATRPDLVTALRDESRTTAGRSKNRLNRALVVAQIALSLVLLVAAGLSVRSLSNAHRIDPGFDPSNLILAPYMVELRGYDEPRGRAFYEDLAERVKRLPGVESVSAALHFPLTFEVRTTSVAGPEQKSGPIEDWPEIDTTRVAPGYFETLRIPMLAGRDFAPEDDADAPAVVIVNEELAHRMWPDESPLGQTLWVGGVDQAATVVGLVRNSRYRTLGEAQRPYVYQPLRAAYEGTQQLLVRTAGDPRELIQAVRNEARALDPMVPTSGIKTAEEAIGAVMILPRLSAGLFGLFGVLGLVLAVSGLFGLVSYTTSQRTHEIGVRLAMGARRRDIQGLVLRQGLVLTGLGVATGVVLAVLVSRSLQAILYGIQPTDLPTYTAVAGLLVAVSLLAGYLPARRAARTDPMTALRYD